MPAVAADLRGDVVLADGGTRPGPIGEALPRGDGIQEDGGEPGIQGTAGRAGDGLGDGAASSPGRTAQGDAIVASVNQGARARSGGGALVGLGAAEGTISADGVGEGRRGEGVEIVGGAHGSPAPAAGRDAPENAVPGLMVAAGLADGDGLAVGAGRASQGVGTTACGEIDCDVDLVDGSGASGAELGAVAASLATFGVILGMIIVAGVGHGSGYLSGC